MPSIVDSEGTIASSPDPLLLSSKLKTAASTEAIRNRNVKKFYRAQNETIGRFLKPVDEHIRTHNEQFEARNLKIQIAIYASLVCNICLGVLQVWGAVISGSPSLYATMSDAIFDPLSNLCLFLCHRAIKSVDSQSYPSGKSRIATAGNVVFSMAMMCVSAIIIAFSIKELLSGAPESSSPLNAVTLIPVSISLGVKLTLFIYCWPLKSHGQVKMLWEDHRNDVVVNAFGLFTSAGGHFLKWWVDPAGAIILSFAVILLWGRTAYKEFKLLIGISADPAMLQWITYIAMTHSPLITAVDTVRAYHSGPRLIVEVDVVVDPMLLVKLAHDMAEELQSRLESLPDVERAYVHVDYETSHKPEHFLKKEV